MSKKETFLEPVLLKSHKPILKINEIFWILAHALRQYVLFLRQNGHAHRTCTVVARRDVSPTPSVGIGNRLESLTGSYVKPQAMLVTYEAKPVPCFFKLGQ